MNPEPGGTHAMPCGLVRRRPAGVARAPAPGSGPMSRDGWQAPGKASSVLLLPRERLAA